jgi:DNA polymerase I-like protein with 3'-5' exonuclease and polymerase domains
MKILAFDIESNGLNEVIAGKKKEYHKEATKVWCLSVIDVDSGEKYLFEQDNMDQGIQMLRSADTIVGHNVLGFDIPLIERLFGSLDKQPYQNVLDTLILSRMLYADDPPTEEGSHSLAAWGKALGLPKIDYVGGWETYNATMGDYCVQDSVVTIALFNKLKAHPHYTKYSRAIRMEHVVAEMIRHQVENGFGFDLEKALALEMELLIEKSKIEDDMRGIFPDKVITRISKKTGKILKNKIEVFNPGSRLQIAQRLAEKYNFEPEETEKGNPRVDHDVLSQLEYPEAKFLCSYFDIIKLMSQVSDWIARAKISRDGRIHGYINTLGTITGRMSAKEPNMQQVSSDPRARALFKPRDGWVLVGSDLKGLELRMLAHYLFPYDKGIYAEEVVRGDIHTHNQKAMNLGDRNTAKTAIYCFLYGGGDTKFGKTINVSTYKAKKVKEDLLNNIPGLKKLIDRCRFDAVGKGEVIPFNWRPIKIRKEHAALNSLLQSSGALIAKAWACVANQRLLMECSGRFAWVASVHDELQLECHPDVAHKIGKILCESATKAGELLKCDCLIEAEFKIGSNWSETH